MIQTDESSTRKYLDTDRLIFHEVVFRYRQMNLPPGGIFIQTDESFTRWYVDTGRQIFHEVLFRYRQMNLPRGGI